MRVQGEYITYMDFPSTDNYTTDLPLRGDPRCLAGISPRDEVRAFFASLGPDHDHLAGQIVVTLLRVEGHLARSGEEVLERFGLSLPKFDVAMSLWISGTPLQMHELAERLLRPASNLTGLVDRLERDGLVRRLADPEDRRVTLVEITPEGVARVKGALPVLNQSARRLIRSLDAEERQRLLHLLAKLEDSLLAQPASATTAR